MKTMTLDKIMEKPLSEEDRKIINNSKAISSNDCPFQTEEELKEFKPWYYIHPNGDDIYQVKIKKQLVSIRLDCDILSKLKSESSHYQSRINTILREHLFPNGK